MKLKNIVLLLLATTSVSVHAITISQWTFESNTPADATDSATSPSVADESGNANGTASGRHASASTDWTTPVGNGSANAFSANTWAVGDYFQFRFSTVGFFDVFVSFDQTSSGTGPKDFRVAYSTDGSVFTDFQSYVVLNGSGSWSSGSVISASQYGFDLSSVAAIEDAADVYLRLVNTSTARADGTTPAVAAGGTDRVDNFVVTGSKIPVLPVPDGLPLGVTAIALFGLIAFSHRVSVRRV